METRHVKLDYDEALNAKKNLLTCELNIIHILKKLQSYQALRQQGYHYKNRLRISMRDMRSKTNQLILSLPQELPKEGPAETAPLGSGEKMIKKGNKKQIQNDLEEIRRRLDRLNEE